VEQQVICDKFNRSTLYEYQHDAVCVCRFPQPAFPPVDRFQYVAVDAFGIAIVAFAINIAMAKMFAKKHGYSLDSNQVDILDSYDF